MKTYSLVGIIVFLLASFGIHEYFTEQKLKWRDERITELEQKVWQCHTDSLFGEMRRKLGLTIKSYYHTNLTRDEMREALTAAVNDSIYLFVPGDTTVMPYLNKAKKEVELKGEYVRR